MQPQESSNVPPEGASRAEFVQVSDADLVQFALPTVAQTHGVQPVVQSNPVAALLVAAAFGFMLGRVLDR
ncbi:MAG: hypothetical protein LC791_15035 [Acidobacteria bacterium]|nr:hypothetical protein [Acidobacteriota bacterium]